MTLAKELVRKYMRGPDYEYWVDSEAAINEALERAAKECEKMIADKETVVAFANAVRRLKS